MSQSSTSPHGRSVKIFKQTYQLPGFTDSQIQKLRQSIQSRQQVIQTGIQDVEVIVEKDVTIPGFLGLFGQRRERRKVKQRQSKPISIEERFVILEGQIRDYDSLMAILDYHKDAYRRFLYDLSQEIEAIFMLKCQQIQAVDAKRRALETKNAKLRQVALGQKRQLVDGLVLLDKAAVLMLKKIALIDQGIQKLTQDNHLQKKLLIRLRSEFQDYQQAIEVQREIDQLHREISEMTQVAINFEEYLKQYLGPFQELINDAAKIDGQLGETVEEIRRLAEDLIASENLLNWSTTEAVSEQILDFYVLGYEKHARLQEALDAAQQQSSSHVVDSPVLSDAAVAQLSIGDALCQIQGHVAEKMQQLRGTSGLMPSPSPTSPTKPTPQTPNPTSFTESLPNGISLDMVAIPAGEFWMGQTEAEKAELIRLVGADKYKDWYATELPRHLVKVPAFYMGKYPVTQSQYEAVMGHNPSHFQGANRPVERVSWEEAVVFCTRLSERTGKLYRLPTEAEWEYACRAGTTTPFYFGETISTDQVNYDGTSTYGSGVKGVYRKETTNVGSFPANAFGLYDLHGNVWEWCADQWYGSYANKPEALKQNGAIAWTEATTQMASQLDEATYRVVRGGSWNLDPWYCRSAYRYRYNLDSRGISLGFRLVCSVSRTP